MRTESKTSLVFRKGTCAPMGGQVRCLNDLEFPFTQYSALSTLFLNNLGRR
jgi:hypothetical protein